jgi:hypothetical protein
LMNRTLNHRKSCLYNFQDHHPLFEQNTDKWGVPTKSGGKKKIHPPPHFLIRALRRACT